MFSSDSTSAAKLGILTAGGDCPGLNAVIRAVVRRAAARGAAVVGFEDGFAGLAEDRVRLLDPEESDRILWLGGSVLGCSGVNPFNSREQAGVCLETYRRHELDALVVVGGNTSQAIALQAHQMGLRTIGIPKTIDNDVAGTDVTVGFDTAVAVATDAIDRLRTTAESHDRVMVVETMGRDVGWIAVAAGLASGADIILTPEEPIRIGEIVEAVRRDQTRSKNYSIIVVGEGAKFEGETFQTGRQMTKDGLVKLGGIGSRLADRIAEETGYLTTVSMLGHIQRGGTPTAADRILATRFGVRAADLALDGASGVMVAMTGGQLTEVPMEEVAGRIKPVDRQLLAATAAINARRRVEISEA